MTSRRQVVVMRRRIYCVPCHEICPDLDEVKQAAWMQAHVAEKHPPVPFPDPMGKDPYFAPAPLGWG